MSFEHQEVCIQQIKHIPFFSFFSLDTCRKCFSFFLLILNELASRGEKKKKDDDEEEVKREAKL